MQLPPVLRAGIRAAASRVPDLDDLTAARDRAPAIAVDTALRGVELGVAGYAALARHRSQVTDAVRKGLAARSSLLGRLSVSELVALREYERAHADRLPVVKAFDTRLATLAKESSAHQQVPTT